MSIVKNIAGIQERIEAACRRASRGSGDIALMAVSKTHPPERIREAYDAGLRLFGENRVQEFGGKAGALGDLADASWHLIGHLQSNKTAKAVELFDAVDSVDSVKLAQKLNAAAQPMGKTLDVLIEINIGGEEAKSGIAPGSADLESLLTGAQTWSNLTFRGLMTIPPYTDDAQAARPYFKRLSALRDEIERRKLPAIRMDVLSMGMSHDFEVAIEEGSTCIRVGTAIFGQRQ